MRTRQVAMIILLGVTTALAAAALGQQSVSAQCGPNDPPCPPDKEREKKTQPTPLPPTPTETSTPLPPPVACEPPDESELATLCANVLPVGTSGGAALDLPAAPVPPVPDAQPMFSGLPGGGVSLAGILIGLLTGILIGLLLPAVSRALPFGKRPVVAPTDSQWHKTGDRAIPVPSPVQEMNGPTYNVARDAEMLGTDDFHKRTESEFSKDSFHKQLENEFSKDSFHKHIKSEHIKGEHIKGEHIKNEHIKNEHIKNEFSKNEFSKNEFSKNEFSKNEDSGLNGLSTDEMGHIK